MMSCQKIFKLLSNILCQDKRRVEQILNKHVPLIWRGSIFSASVKMSDNQTASGSKKLQNMSLIGYI